MAEEIKLEEHVGPLNNVEILLVKGEHDRHDAEVKRLEEVQKNLEGSLVKTKRELQSLKDRQAGMLREILKQRGKDPGRLPTRVFQRQNDNTTWIVVGGQSLVS